MCPYCNSEKILTANKRCKLSLNPISIEQRDDVCCNGTMFQGCAYYLTREIPKRKDPYIEPRLQLLQIYADARPSIKERLDEAFGNKDGFVVAMLERYHEYAPTIATGLSRFPMDPPDPIAAVSLKDGVIFDYFPEFLLFPWSGTHPRNGSLSDILGISNPVKIPAKKKASQEAMYDDDAWDDYNSKVI